MGVGRMKGTSKEQLEYALSFLEPGSFNGGTFASILEQITSEERRIEFCRHFKIPHPLCRQKAILNEPLSDDAT